MKATATVDTVAMDRAFTALANFSPVSLRATLRAEAGSILKTCAGRTKVSTAKQQEIAALRMALRRGNASTKNLERVSVTVGIRGNAAYGKVWRLTGNAKRLGVQQTHGPNFSPLNRHYTDEAWHDIRAVVARFLGALKTARPAVKNASGLARQSWVQIADDLGIRLEEVPGGGISQAGIAKARRALATNGVAYKNGQAREYGEARKFTIELTNQLPYGRAIRLDNVLSGAITGRIKFFERNLSLGTFQSLDKMLKAYPGIRLAYNGPTTMAA